MNLRVLLSLALVCVFLLVIGCRNESTPSSTSAEPPDAAMPDPVAEVAVDPLATERLNLRWDYFESAGPLAIVPTRRSVSEHFWGPQQQHLFAALYSKEAFQDLEDFTLFTRYTSSIQQFLIRDGEADLDWFIPEPRDEGVEGLRRQLQSTLELSGDAAGEMFLAWNLPENAAWVSDLAIQRAFVSASDEGLEVTAEANQGYLCMFALLD